MVIAGLLGVVFLYVSASGLISVTHPFFTGTNGDTMAHVDMIYRIYNGDLPKASDGIRYQPFIDLGGGNVYQRASGHPPLFHILHAPIVGPLLNAGEWQKAIALGRALNIFFGILCIFALAWAGWLFGGKRKALFAVAVPALAVLTYRFSRLNTDYALDGLLTLWTTLTLICLYKILQNGLRANYLIFLTLLSVAGMSTKISYVVFLGICVLVVIIANYLHGNQGTRKNVIRGTAIAAGIMVVVVVLIGWYYYFQNYRASGSLVTPIQANLAPNRPYQSYRDILTSSNFWALLYARYSVNIVVSTIITSFTIAGYFSMKKGNLAKLKKNLMTKWTILLMCSAFLGILATQLMLAHPNGSINFRYLLPAILPISLFLAYGLLEFKWLRGQLVALAAIAMAGTTILSIRLAQAPDGLLQGVKLWGKTVDKIYTVTTKNGVPSYVTTTLFLMFAIGALLLSVGLYHLSKTQQSNSKKPA